MNPVLKATVATLGVAAVLVGLWFGGWWLREDSVNRTSEINNDSYARQNSLAEQVIDLHSEIADLDVRAAGDLTDEQKELIGTQRAALVTNLCDAYDQTTGTTTIPSDIHAFAAQEC